MNREGRLLIVRMEAVNRSADWQKTTTPQPTNLKISVVSTTVVGAYGGACSRNENFSKITRAVFCTTSAIRAAAACLLMNGNILCVGGFVQAAVSCARCRLRRRRSFVVVDFIISYIYIYIMYIFTIHIYIY